MKLTRQLFRGTLIFLVSATLMILAGAVSAAPLTQQKRIREVQRNVRLSSAKMDAAAYIFRYYNRNLSEEKAKEYARFVMEASHRYSIDPALITGIIIKESTAKATARSKYAVGLMQVYWQLHKKTIGSLFPHIQSEKVLMEPRNNIMVGTWLFSQYMINCKGDVTKALRRYLGSQATHYVALVTKYRGQFSERVSYNLQRAVKRHV